MKNQNRSDAAKLRWAKSKELKEALREGDPGTGLPPFIHSRSGAGPTVIVTVEKPNKPPAPDTGQQLASESPVSLPPPPFDVRRYNNLKAFYERHPEKRGHR